MQRIYYILISGSLALLGILGIVFISDDYLGDSAADPIQTFEGFMGLILIIGISIVTFMYHLIVGMIELMGYLWRGQKVTSKMKT